MREKGGNPKKDKRFRRKRPERKNPLKRINQFAEKIKPEFKETQVTEEMAKKRIDHLRKVFLGKTWKEKLSDSIKGLLWKIQTKINKIKRWRKQ